MSRQAIPSRFSHPLAMCYLSSHTQTETKWSMLAVSQNYSMCSILYTALFVIPGYSVMVFPTKNRRSPPTKNPQNDPSGRTNRRGLRSADSSWLRAMHQSSHIPSLVSLVVLWPTSTVKSFPFHARLPAILQHVLYDARLLKQFPSSDTWNVAQNKVMNLQIGTKRRLLQENYQVLPGVLLWERPTCSLSLVPVLRSGLVLATSWPTNY